MPCNGDHLDRKNASIVAVDVLVSGLNLRVGPPDQPPLMKDGRKLSGGAIIGERPWVTTECLYACAALQPATERRIWSR